MDAARSADVSPVNVGFIGDLDDPWIAAIADAVAQGRAVHRLNVAGTLPEHPFDRTSTPRVVVVHRHHLTDRDAARLETWPARGRDEGLRLVLCISPYARYAELERWSALVDMVVSEAIAAEVLPGRLARWLDGAARTRSHPPGPSVRIEVAGGDGELGRALVEACRSAGYIAQDIDESEVGGTPGPAGRRGRPAPAGQRVLTVWEVPVLEPGWAQRLEWRAARTGPVIALAGFADRAVVARAHEAGAAACLELPCDVNDLIAAVDRVIDTTPADSWPVPGRAEPPHILPPPRRKARQSQPRGMTVAPSTWPDRGASLQYLRAVGERVAGVSS